ncbi:F0F1 ATP synthase subunit delta [Candidatus Kaiserbacteria bacterium]|nr:F0F1 ATP synthase subunit delta [Candidatus Kaiserbacteria bacterium]
MDHRKAVTALRDILQSHGRTALLPRVAKAFERIAEREAKRTDIVLTVAREADERRAHTQVKEALSELQIDSKSLKTRVDPTIVGGWRLEGNGVLVDASYKKALLDMYNRAIQ